jgi:Ca2+-binding RTX toxin-like protein
MKRSITTGLALLAVALVAAAPASAGTLSVSGGAVVYQANPGETNVLTAQFGFRTGLVVVVRDKGARITAGPGCVAVGQRGVCALAPLKIKIFADDRNDSATVTGAAVEFHGGAGNDSVTADDYADQLYGDAGDDRLNGGAKESSSLTASFDDAIYGGDGNDVLVAGPGDDTLYGEAGNDVLDGGGDGDRLDGGLGADVLRGAGNTIDNGAGVPRRFVDSALYWDRTASVYVTLDGVANDGEAGEGDNVAVDVEEVYGGVGNDTLEAPATEVLDDYSAVGFEHSLFGRGGDDLLIGGSQRNRLVGEEGNDTLRGNAGRDLLEGDAGDDTLYARDGEADSASCGFGADSAQIDIGIDLNPFGCETFLP